MKEGQFTPKEYLDRHLEPVGEVDWNAEDNTPILNDNFEPDFTRENANNEIVHDDGQTKFTIQYSELPEELRESMLQNSKFLPSPHRTRLQEFLAGQVYCLQVIELEKTESEAEGSEARKVDIAALVPSEIGHIYINPSQSAEIHPDGRGFLAAISSGPCRGIFFEGNIGEIGTIAGILHEIGHMRNKVTKEQKAASHIYHSDVNIDEKDAAVILRSERDAWVFAIRQLKPFLRTEARDALLYVIHRRALQSHSESLRKMLPEPEQKGYLNRLWAWIKEEFNREG